MERTRGPGVSVSRVCVFSVWRVQGLDFSTKPQGWIVRVSEGFQAQLSQHPPQGE